MNNELVYSLKELFTSHGKGKFTAFVDATTPDTPHKPEIVLEMKSLMQNGQPNTKNYYFAQST